VVVIHVVAARRVRRPEALRPRAAHHDVGCIVRVIVGANHPLGGVGDHVVRAVGRHAFGAFSRGFGLIQPRGLFLRGAVGPPREARPARRAVLRLVVARAGLVIVSVRESSAFGARAGVHPLALAAEPLAVVLAPGGGLGRADHEQRLRALAIGRLEAIDAGLAGEHHVGGAGAEGRGCAGRGRGADDGRRLGGGHDRGRFDRHRGRRGGCRSVTRRRGASRCTSAQHEGHGMQQNPGKPPHRATVPRRIFRGDE
jgi:hypothetical protein